MSSRSPAHYHRIAKAKLPKSQGLVLAIGNLDGVHLGHAALLETTRQLAAAKGYKAAALTFEPHPRIYFNPEIKPLNIMRVSQKINVLQAHGMDTVIVANFSKNLAEMPAKQFIEEFCVGELGAKHVVTGANFRFGKDRSGDASLMADTMQSLNLGYSCVNPVLCEDGEAISSTRIRMLLKTGDMGKAAQLLGRPYCISGRVVRGDKRGRTLGFPTANISVNGLFLPTYGVYAVTAEIDGMKYQGVANLGIRPTHAADKPLLEVHIFDMDRDIYGKRLNVALHRFLRPEQKFTSIQSMIDQLGHDVLEAKAFHQSN
jgi:riboflavin kinase/FMN adenylyltransferase